jgi:replicative superfamily II helicase
MAGKKGQGTKYASKYDAKLVEDMLAEIAEGNPASKVCKKYNVSRTAFHEWVKRKEWIDKYARAVDERAYKIFEEILEIADDKSEDIVIIDGKKYMNAEFVQRSRLRIDARKWFLSKMLPRKFGEKIDITTNGGDVAPVVINLGNGKKA